jgi:hypothetical protein
MRHVKQLLAGSIAILQSALAYVRCGNAVCLLAAALGLQHGSLKCFGCAVLLLLLLLLLLWWCSRHQSSAAVLAAVKSQTAAAAAAAAAGASSQLRPHQ